MTVSFLKSHLKSETNSNDSPQMVSVMEMNLKRKWKMLILLSTLVLNMREELKQVVYVIIL